MAPIQSSQLAFVLNLAKPPRAGLVLEHFSVSRAHVSYIAMWDLPLPIALGLAACRRGCLQL